MFLQTTAGANLRELLAGSKALCFRFTLGLACFYHKDGHLRWTVNFSTDFPCSDHQCPQKPGGDPHILLMIIYRWLLCAYLTDGNAQFEKEQL